MDGIGTDRDYSMTKQPEPFRYLHSAGHLSPATTYQLIITGPRKVTANELEALIVRLKIDVEILRDDAKQPEGA